MRQHSLPVRIYYDNTDISGIVHHSNYLKFFERGRTESLRELGFELLDLYENYEIQFVVRSATLEFLQPARLDQLLYVVTTVESVRQASIVYDQRLILKETLGDALQNQHTAATLCIGKLKLACVNRNFKPCALPEVLSREIKK